MLSRLVAQRRGGRRIASVACILIAAFGLAIALVWVPHCVSTDVLAAIRPGMTKEEVITLLGPPQSNSSGSLDGLAAIRPGMTSEEVTRLLAAPQGNSVDGPIHRIRMLRYWSRFRW